ncbi:MAG: IS1595 family transposase [Acidobacteriia bacterium]|nr:IS1595 family transposase [Terriglobia bacterium]
MEPTTLQEAIVYFSSPVNCREYMVARRWPNGVTCPKCGSANVLFLEKYNRWHCRDKHKAPQFTLKTGTIFEDSPLGLDKWLTAMWMVVNCRNGVSSYEIHRALNVTQKSAWFMDHRIRLALQQGSLVKLGGGMSEVEVDETFIGGKARNMHKDVKARRITTRHGNNAKDKVLVMGMVERGGHVRTEIITDRFTDTLRQNVNKHVALGTFLYSDELQAYKGLKDEYVHQFVDHAERYVTGRVHTNGIENFWSLLKRGLNGTYVAVEPFHLFRYLDEQAFRYNHRKDNRGNRLNDGERFSIALSQIVGKRITYKELTGKEGQGQADPF